VGNPHDGTPEPGVIGICSRCAVYDNDHSEKKLYQCPYCGEWFCEEHIEPSLVLTFSQYQELWRKYRDLRDFLENEWHKKNGHPCYPYTQQFWRTYEEKKKRLYSISKTSKRKVIKADHTTPQPRISRREKHYTPKEKPKKSKTKYAVATVAVLLLLLVGIGYIIGNFENIKLALFGEHTSEIEVVPQVNTQTEVPPSTTNAIITTTTITDSSRPTYTTTIVVETNTETNTQVFSSSSICSSGYWRYVFKEALKCALTQEELSKVSYLAEELKGVTLQESAWNILEWLSENIEYDYYKASLPNPIIWTSSDGSIIDVSGGEGTEIQTPYETIQKGKGVCTDYTILTTALLLEMHYAPIYMLDINFENSQTGHTATAIKIDGEYFILDQNPPVMDLGTYYKYWSNYRKDTLGEVLFISNATVYEVWKSGKNIEIKKVDVLTAEDFKSRDHEFNSIDLARISKDLKEMFKKNYPNLIPDSGIKYLDRRIYLPPGYSDGRTWMMEFPHFVDYYNPVFNDEIVRYFYMSLASDREIKNDLSRFNRFWIRVTQEGDSIKVVLNLAKK